MIEKLFAFSLAVAATLVSGGAWACSCSDNPQPNYTAFIRSIDRLSEYKVISVRTVRGGWIATARTLRDWKNDDGPKVFEVMHYDTSCDSKPTIGRSGWGIVPLYSLKEADRYTRPYCFPNITPTKLAEYEEGQRALEQRARNTPDDVEAQIAWVADLNFWNLHKRALGVIADLERRFPDNPRIVWEKAAALAGEGRLEEAQVLNRWPGDTPSLSGRSTFLDLDIEARRARAKRGAALLSERVNVGYVTSLRGDLSRVASRGWRVPSAIDARESDWREAQLTNAGIDGILFTKTNLERANFTESSLTGADLAGAKAAQAHFRKARLSGSNLRGIVAPSADFTEADLTRADLGDGDFTKANFRAAKLSAARLEGSRFDQANLEIADLSGTSSKGASFVKANLANADLRGADLSAADLSEADLDGALVDCATRFPETFDRSQALLIPTQACADSKPVDFRAFDADRLRGGRSRRLQPDFEKANLTGAHFEGMWVWQNYIGAVLDDAKFSGAHLERIFLKGISARGADFADFSGRISISRSELSNATLIGRGKDLATIEIVPDGSKLDGAVIRNVVLKVDSAWRGDALAVTSTEGAIIEETEIHCPTWTPEASSVYHNDSARNKEQNRRADLDRFVAAHHLARTLAALGKTNHLEPACARAIDSTLGGGCAAGRIAMKYDYACPAAP